MRQPHCHLDRQVENLIYLADDDVRIISDHDERCFAGVDKDLLDRFETRWESNATDPLNPAVTFLKTVRPGELPFSNDADVTGIEGGGFFRPSVVSQAVEQNLRCGRDHKWRLVSDTINRLECDCERQFYVIIAVYRLWKCTSNELDDDLGIAGVNRLQTRFRGGRGYWFPFRRPAERSQCDFNLTSPSSLRLETYANLNLTVGAIPSAAQPALSDDMFDAVGNGALHLGGGLAVQFTWMQQRTFYSYDELKAAVQASRKSSRESRRVASRWDGVGAPTTWFFASRPVSSHLISARLGSSRLVSSRFVSFPTVRPARDDVWIAISWSWSRAFGGDDDRTSNRASTLRLSLPSCRWGWN